MKTNESYIMSKKREKRTIVGRIFVFGLACLFFSSALFAGRILSPPKKPPARQKCCPIGISYLSGPGKVMLEKICNKGDTSIFQMRLFGIVSVCTNPRGTVLRDESGHRYPMRSFSGIPSCRNNGFLKRGAQRFYWVFPRLRKGVKKIDLVEVEDETTRGLSFWAWRNVDVSHCKF